MTTSMATSIRHAHHTVVEASELPRMVRLGRNLYGACFSLMKQLPARFILDRAREAGQVRPGSTVIESTSGTFGLALAIVCALRGYRLIIVSDPVIDDALARRLADLGARVEIVPHPAPVGGYQRARLNRLEELRAACPDSFWPCQYDNPHNLGAYAPFAELLAESIGRVDHLVGTVGSGGSTCGTTRYLRALLPALRVSAVDTHGSVLFGQPDRPRALRGLGNSLMPRNLEHTCFDDIHWVPAADAFSAARTLHRQHALYMGATSGAAYLVAEWWARTKPDATVVALLPDEGHRYQSTIYNDDWLRREGLWLAAPPREPRVVQTVPVDADDWCQMAWQRRTYEQVLGHPFQAERA